MGWTLARAKEILGITDDTQDGAIQNVMDSTLARVQLVLQRELILGRHTVEFHRHDCAWSMVPGYRRVMLPRFPIRTIHTVNGVPPNGNISVNKRHGWVDFPADVVVSGDLEVDYTGGFEELPADLERALWGAFLLDWGQSNQDTGGPGEGVTETSEAPVKSVTVYDGFRVDMDTGSETASSTADQDSEATWGDYANWASVFDRYRSENAADLVIG